MLPLTESNPPYIHSSSIHPIININININTHNPHARPDLPGPPSAAYPRLGLIHFISHLIRSHFLIFYKKKYLIKRVRSVI